MLRNEKATHAVADLVPHSILAKFMTVWNGNSSHESLVCLSTRGVDKFVLGCPVNELGPTSLGTHTGIVEICLVLGDLVGGGVNGGGTGDAVVVGPE